MATMAASLNDLTNSLPIRRGETWLCQLGHEPESLQCRLVGTCQRQTWTFADRGSHTCVLIEAEDYQPNSSERPKVDIWGFTQIILPRDAAFALTCVEAGRRPPTIPWRCLYPADSQDAQRQNSIWIDIDTEENLVVLRSEADALISIAVSRHPEGWANS
jgi:hypothetical protein